MMMWLYGCRWLKWERIPACEVMSVVHLGMGHVVGMVGSGIDTMYSSRLAVSFGSFVSSSGVSRFGSSLCTCLRWLSRLPCCRDLSHLGQVVIAHWRWRYVGPCPVMRHW